MRSPCTKRVSLREIKCIRIEIDKNPKIAVSNKIKSLCKSYIDKIKQEYDKGMMEWLSKFLESVNPNDQSRESPRLVPVLLFLWRQREAQFAKFKREISSLLNIQMYRREVLSVYRQTLRVAKGWKASSGNLQDTIEEKNYIEKECKTLFRQNIALSESQEIKACLEEAKSRLELALHYNNPYPRPVNLPQMALAQHGKTKFKGQQRARKHAKPIYLHSHKELD